MSPEDLALLDRALEEWVRALVAQAAPGDTQRHEDETHTILVACVAPERLGVAG